MDKLLTGWMLTVLMFPAFAVADTPAAGAAPMAAHAGHNPAAMMHAASRLWTTQPLLKSRMSGEDRATRIVTIVPQNIAPDTVDAYSNNLQDAVAHRQLQMGMAGAKLDKPSTGGFQLLSAREEQADAVRVASTVYYFGERGAKNPTDMFMLQKNELEIIPQPFPREHSRYRVNEDWKFLVRFNGQPLTNRKVKFETSNGTASELVTDAMGGLNLHVPDDLRPIEAKKESGGHDHGMRRGGDFVLAVEYIEGGKTYLTAFNSGYGPDAYDQRSLALGLGFTLLGMAGAAPLLRQRKAVKKSAAVKSTDKKDEA